MKTRRYVWRRGVELPTAAKPVFPQEGWDVIKTSKEEVIYISSRELSGVYKAGEST